MNVTIWEPEVRSAATNRNPARWLSNPTPPPFGALEDAALRFAASAPALSVFPVRDCLLRGHQPATEEGLSRIAARCAILVFCQPDSGWHCYSRH